MSILDKYNSEFASFYKDKLISLCEGKEWTCPPVGSRQKKVAAPKQIDTNEIKSLGSGGITSGPALKQRNEEYFAKKGGENLNRPDNLHPNQGIVFDNSRFILLILGGKFSGFGNPNFPDAPVNDNKMPDDLFENPMATLSKGWSIFSSYAAEGFLVLTQAQKQHSELRNLSERL